MDTVTKGERSQKSHLTVKHGLCLSHVCGFLTIQIFCLFLSGIFFFSSNSTVHASNIYEEQGKVIWLPTIIREIDPFKSEIAGAGKCRTCRIVYENGEIYFTKSGKIIRKLSKTDYLPSNLELMKLKHGKKRQIVTDYKHFTLSPRGSYVIESLFHKVYSLYAEEIGDCRECSISTYDKSTIYNKEGRVDGIIRLGYPFYFSPNEKYIVSYDLCLEGKIREYDEYDTDCGKIYIFDPRGQLLSVYDTHLESYGNTKPRFSPNGHFVIISRRGYSHDDDIVVIYDSLNNTFTEFPRTRLKALDLNHPNCAISNNGKIFACIQSNSPQLRLFDMRFNSLLYRYKLNGFWDEIFFTPDNLFLVGFNDQELRLLDLSNPMTGDILICT